MARQTYMWNQTVLSPEQVAQVLWQAGLRDQTMLAAMVGVDKRESGYRAGVHGSDSPQSRVSGDRGLFQINYIHDPKLKAAGIISKPEDLFDPVINAKAALYLMGMQGDGSVTQNTWKGFGQLWGAGPGGWTSGGDPFYGVNRQAAEQAVRNAQSSGLIGQPYASSAITSGAASGAASPLANPGSGELGWVNANAQNQRDYYNQQNTYLAQLFQLGDKRSNLEYEEHAANKLYQATLQGVYTDVNKVQGVFNKKDFESLKQSLAELTNLQQQGFQGTQKYHQAQTKLERAVYDATIGYLDKQKTTAGKTAALAKLESGFVYGENVRKRSSEAIKAGARLAEGTGADMAAFLRQRQLQDQGTDISYEGELNRIGNERQQAALGWEDQQQDRNEQLRQAYLQYQTNLSDLRYRGRENQSRYDKTASELWVKARELQAQGKLNQSLQDIQYRGIGLGKDIDYTQYLQSAHSVQNQFQQVGVNQVRDIQDLNQRRQAEANAALLSLSPYG